MADENIGRGHVKPRRQARNSSATVFAISTAVPQRGPLRPSLAGHESTICPNGASGRATASQPPISLPRPELKDDHWSRTPNLSNAIWVLPTDNRLIWVRLLSV